MKVAFLGQSMIDEIYVLEDEAYPLSGDKTMVHYLETKIGGMTANAATIASSLGIESNLIFEFSNCEDSTKDILLDLSKYNIKTKGISFSPRKNPRCIIIRNKLGERIIYVLNNHTTPLINLSENQKDILFNSDYIYTNLDDLQLFGEKDSICKQLNQNKINIFIDCDSNIDTHNIDCLKYAKIVSFNEFGYKKLLDLNYDINSLFSSTCISCILITQGQNGSTLYTTENKVYNQKAFKIPVKDTSGAGDGFNAGFLYSILRGLNFQDSLIFSSAVAAFVVSQFGTRVTIDISHLKSLFPLKGLQFS